MLKNGKVRSACLLREKRERKNSLFLKLQSKILPRHPNNLRRRPIKLPQLLNDPKGTLAIARMRATVLERLAEKLLPVQKLALFFLPSCIAGFGFLKFFVIL